MTAPEHRAADGGFVCENCGATRRTSLGISRHRSLCNRRSVDAETDQEDRDCAAELDAPEAGEHGIPFDAVCTGCGQVRVKRADEDPENPTSFKHVCHRCKTSTWWNPVRTLTGLMRMNEHPYVAGDDE